MKKLILGILAILVLVVALGFSAFVWVGMAGGLQQAVQDNLALLKRDLIMDDRQLTFDYQSYGIEPIGLSPAFTMIQPRIIAKSGPYEYRLTAPELSIIGSFSNLEEMVLQAPAKAQLTIKQENFPPRVLELDLPSHLRLSLLSKIDEAYLWQHYQLKQNLSGRVMVKDTQSGTTVPVKYNLIRTEPRDLEPPYSPHLLPVLRKFSAAVKLP